MGAGRERGRGLVCAAFDEGRGDRQGEGHGVGGAGCTEGMGRGDGGEGVHVGGFLAGGTVGVHVHNAVCGRARRTDEGRWEGGWD